MTNNTVTKNANKLELISAGQFTGEGEILLQNSDKILGITSEAKILSVESFGNELRVNGKLIFQGIYMLKEDGGVDGFVLEKDFSEALPVYGEKLKSAKILSRITDCVYTDTSPVRLNFTFELVGYCIREETLSFLECCESNVYCKKSLVRIENLETLCESSNETSFIYENEMPLKKLLTHNTCVWINNSYAADGMYQAEGEAVSFITACDSEGRLFSRAFSSPFTAEIADPSVRLGSDIYVDVNIKAISVAIDTENNNIAIDMTLGYSGYLLQTEEFEGIADAYSTTNNLDVISSCYKQNSCFCSKLNRVKFSETVKLDFSVSRIESILCPEALTVTSYERNGLYTEGVVCPTVIYRGEDGKLYSKRTELPYKLLVAKDFTCVGDRLPEIKFSAISGRIRGVDEIELVIEFVFVVRGINMDTFCLVSDLTIGEPLEGDDVAISLYLTQKDECLFDVAKALRTTEETLIRLNPDVKLPLSGGEKLLLYRDI